MHYLSSEEISFFFILAFLATLSNHALKENFEFNQPLMVEKSLNLFMDAGTGNNNTGSNGNNGNSIGGVSSGLPAANAPGNGGEERIVYTDGFASAAERQIRDSVITHGYNPNVSNQPYAANLSRRMQLIRARCHNSQDVLTLPPADRAYLDVMIRQLYPNYNPNIHYKNSRSMHTFLRNLP